MRTESGFHAVSAAVLPVGQSDIVRESSVKVYCPKCSEIYYPRSSRHKQLDGAFWGTSFPHLLLLTINNGPTASDKGAKYVPRIFGFRVRSAALPVRAAAEPRHHKSAFGHTWDHNCRRSIRQRSIRISFEVLDRFGPHRGREIDQVIDS